MSSPPNNPIPGMAKTESNVGAFIKLVLLGMVIITIIGATLYTIVLIVTNSSPEVVKEKEKEEVFSTGTYKYTRDQALGACQKYGADLATVSQMQEAQNKEADWCSTGWVKDSLDAYLPITTTLREGCGNGTSGLKKYTPPDNIAGVNCYGVKPAQGTPDILPFNSSKWSSIS